MTQKANAATFEINDALEQTIIRLGRFVTNPDAGYEWCKRRDYNVTEETSRNDRINLVNSLIEHINRRCSNIPSIFVNTAPLLETTQWKEKDFFFMGVNGNRLSTVTMDAQIQALSIDPVVSPQLAQQSVDTNLIISEWQSLKNEMRHWHTRSGKDFPPTSWEAISNAVNLTSYGNLFALVDFLYCHGMSSADAERGFSALKLLKTAKRSTLGNTLLTTQLRTKLEGPKIMNYDPTKAIEYKMLNPGSRSKSGEMRAKRPSYMDNKSFEPKPKVVKTTPVFTINDADE